MKKHTVVALDPDNWQYCLVIRVYTEDHVGDPVNALAGATREFLSIEKGQKYLEEQNLEDYQFNVGDLIVSGIPHSILMKYGIYEFYRLDGDTIHVMDHDEALIRR